MSNRAVFNKFRPVNLLRNRYLRNEWAIWDANLHHGDIRPFACPEKVCEGEGDLFPEIDECCCLTLPDCTDIVEGFCRDQYFWIQDEVLRQSTSTQLCDQVSCRAGSPVPDRVQVSSSCQGDDYDDDYRACVEQAKTVCEDKKAAVDAAYIALIECRSDCEETDCSSLRSDWQAKLTEYNDCIKCITDDCEKQEQPCDAITYHYVITYLTTHSNIVVESSPSLPNYGVTNGSPPQLTITLPHLPDDYCITGVRLYRVESDFQDGEGSMPIDGSEFVFVAELPISTTTYTDNLRTHETRYPLTTSHPMINPAPKGIKYLARTADGIVTATDCQVFISVPGQPMFSLDGVVEVEDTIRAIRADGNTIFVLTDHYPVLIKYQLSEGVMSIDRRVVRVKAPLRSRKSVSLYAGRLYFASEFTLYVWDTSGYGANIKNSIQSVMTPDQWKMVDAGSVVGVAYDYGYLLHSKRLQYSLMIEIGQDHSDTLNQTSIMPISYVCMDDVALDKAGHLWYRNGNDIYKWDWRRDVCELDIHEPGKTSQCDQCCPFTLRLHYDSEGKNDFNVARVEWDNRTDSHVEFRIFEGYFGSHTCIADLEVISSRGFGIPSYSSSQSHWVELKSCGVVHEVRLATSYSDLVSRSNQDMVGRE